MYEIQQFSSAHDFPAYVALLNHVQNNETTEEAQRDYAKNLDIGVNRDRFVVFHPENSTEIIAGCDIWQIGDNPSAECTLLVHPQYRRQGIGSQLLYRGLEHAKTLAATAIDAYAEPEHQAVQAFLEHHKFQRVSNYTAMESKLEAAPEIVALPEGYHVVGYDALDMSEEEKISLLLRCTNEFWGYLWGHKLQKDNQATRASIRQDIIHSFPHDALLFVFKDGAYIGHDRVQIVEDDTGVVGDMGLAGLHPAHRLDVLRLHLVTRGLHYLYQQGCRHIYFQAWGESDATLALVEQQGFKRTSVAFGYQRHL